jgi:hypothetical protein
MKKPGFIGAAGNAFMSVFGISPEKGARTSIFLAASPEVEGKSGRYYARSTESQPSKAAQDDEAAKRLWEISEDLTK